MSKQPKAVALISGGLDSLLAVKVIQEQGVYVEGINFFTGFCVEGHTHAVRKKQQNKPKRNNALWVAEQLGIKLHIIDIVEEYKDIVLNPKHGYGANMNPCLDCKGFMVKKATEWIEAHHFDFVITGEVVGQRPMSQRHDTMPVIAAESGCGERLVRPLCGQLLPPTLAEKEGWIQRDKLLSFSGRNRTPQIRLAKRYGFVDYAQPAGGCCFLTDQNYSKKLLDLWQHRPTRNYTLDDIILLKMGRHIRPKPYFKLIIGREEGENNFLRGYRKEFTHIYATSHTGPLVLLDGKWLNDEDRTLSLRIIARYTQGKNADTVSLDVVDKNGNSQTFTVSPLQANNILHDWYL